MGRHHRPIRLSLRPAVDGRARARVVDEDDTVSDEYIIFDRDSFADKAVRRDFAALTDDRPLLDFDERADLGLTTNPAAIQVHEIGAKDDDTFTESNAGRDRHRGILLPHASEPTH